MQTHHKIPQGLLLERPWNPPWHLRGCLARFGFRLCAGFSAAVLCSGLPSTSEFENLGGIRGKGGGLVFSLAYILATSLNHGIKAISAGLCLIFNFTAAKLSSNSNLLLANHLCA